MSRSFINEKQYFDSIVEMRGTFDMKVKLWRAHDIFKKVNQSEFNRDFTSEEFLNKCYIDSVMELGGIIMCMFNCVKNGVLHKLIDVGGEDSDYEDEEYDKIQERRLEKKQNNIYEFKRAVIDAIVEIDKTRVKVAKHLIERANEPEFIHMFERYLAGRLGRENVLVQMYMCLRHIRSGNIDFDYKFGDKKNAIDMFDSVFCSDKTVEDYAFFANERNSFIEPINEFDMEIVIQKK